VPPQDFATYLDSEAEHAYVCRQLSHPRVVPATSCGKAGSGLRAGTSLSQASQHVRDLTKPAVSGSDPNVSSKRGAMREVRSLWLGAHEQCRSVATE